MFLKQSKYKNGTVFLSIIEGYRDKDGKSKQKTIKKIGYLHELQKTIQDPIDFYTQEAKSMSLEQKKDNFIDLTIDMNKINEIGEHNLYNVGYFVLKDIYNSLNLTDFFNLKNTTSKMDYNLNKIFQLCVFSRILYPGSKKFTFDNKGIFFEQYNSIHLYDIYRSLDHFTKYKTDIEKMLWDYSYKEYKRDMSTTYYDATNYYFEIATNDEDLIDEYGNVLEEGYRKRGPEKNKRPDPIVMLGLLMDSTGIPLAYDLYPGNKSEKKTLRPIVKRAKRFNDTNRTIVVADRGLNTSDNIFFLAGKNDGTTPNNDGYVYGQSIRGADSEFKDWALNEEGFTSEIIKEGENTIAFIHKSRNFGKEIKIERDGKRKNKVIIYQKQMVYFSSKYARKQKRERDLMIKKANDLINSPTKYTKATSYGAANYVKDIKFNKDSGEIVNKELSLDITKIEEEAKFDGYYSIVTSEDKLSDLEIRNIYRGLIKIEDTFKITKSELAGRPAFVWTSEHIESHFLTCFVALVIIRLLEKKLEHKYSIHTIIDSLKKYNCMSLDKNIYQFLHYDETIKDIGLKYNIDLSKKYRKSFEIKKLLKY